MRRSRLILTIVGAILLGVASNRLDSFLLWLGVPIGNLVHQNFWTCLIVGIPGIVFIGTLLYCWRRMVIGDRTLDRAVKMLAIDEHNLRTLACWTTSSNHDQQLKLTLVEFLKRAIGTLGGGVERAAILLPDSTDTYLQCQFSYQMPPEITESMEFYIGDNSRMQRASGGIAGEAFRTRKILVTRKENGQWISEGQAQCIDFHGAHPNNPYLALVDVPLIAIDPNTGTDTTTCIGIIHLESREIEAFTSRENKLMLENLAVRITATILISKKFH